MGLAMPGILYVVATPIGNLEDVTQRALRVLSSVALVAAEDTRHSRKLLEHFAIATQLTSYHDHSEREKAPRLVERLLAGDDVALICDAGTPAIADPGYRLVRAAIEAGVRVVPIPGASALTACLSVSGLPTDRFAFEGFVPARAAARRGFYADLADERRTIVCFEAGRRLVESLRDLEAAMGRRDVVVGREVTKMYEDFSRGPVDVVAERLEGAAVRGEVTLLIAGAPDVKRADVAEVRRRIAELRAAGTGMKAISRQVAGETGWSGREVYELGVAMAKDGD